MYRYALDVVIPHRWKFLRMTIVILKNREQEDLLDFVCDTGCINGKAVLNKISTQAC